MVSLCDLFDITTIPLLTLQPISLLYYKSSFDLWHPISLSRLCSHLLWPMPAAFERGVGSMVHLLGNMVLLVDPWLAKEVDNTIINACIVKVK